MTNRGERSPLKKRNRRICNEKAYFRPVGRRHGPVPGCLRQQDQLRQLRRRQPARRQQLRPRPPRRARRRARRGAGLGPRHRALDVHHSNELGNDAEAIESTRMGTIDIIFAGTSGFTSFYEKAKVLDLPFLFDSAEQAYEVTNSDVGEQIFADFPQYGLIYLAEGDNGMRHISTTNRPIHTADDVAGLKIRVPTSQLYLDVWEALGAPPVALALPELALALSNGTAEGQDNATYHLVANATYDDIKYFSNINYMWMGCTMAVNSVTWSKLAPEVQDILKEQAKVAAKYSFDTIAADNETASPSRISWAATLTMTVTPMRAGSIRTC